jgi:multicomponent Na+:H+ antiporter subunit D
MTLDSYTASYIAALAPLIAIITAFVTPLLSSLSRKPQRFAFILSELVFILNALLVSLVFEYVYTTRSILVYMFAGFPPPLGIIYEVDLANAFIGLLVGLVFPLVNIASYRYLENSTKHNEWYYVLYLGLEAGLLGLSYTGDLFNLFVMLEVTSIAAYGLTAYLREKGYTLKAAIKYGMFGAVGSTIYFLAVVLLYSGIGTLTMADAASSSLGLPYFSVSTGLAINPIPVLVFFGGLALWALLIESAIFPHHFWLPDAYSSMPPAAAGTMAAVAEGVAAYVIIRILYTIVGVSHIEWALILLLILGSCNIIFGGYLLATAKEIKRMIAYSTILDMGYVALGIGIGSAEALEAVFFYILSHAIVKPLLFIAAGSTEITAGTTMLDKLQGAFRGSPYLAASFLIGGLAIMGVPPFNMFFAKLALFEAVFNSGYYILLIIMLMGSALAFVGFARLWYTTLTVRSKKAYESGVSGNIGGEIKVLLVTFMLLVILTGLFYGVINDRVLAPVVQSLISHDHRVLYVKKAYELFMLIRR